MATERQKRLGPAPIASFEDLSDELISPEEKTKLEKQVTVEQCSEKYIIWAIYLKIRGEGVNYSKVASKMCKL